MKVREKDLTQKFQTFVSGKSTEITLVTSFGDVFVGKLSEAEVASEDTLVLKIDDFQKVIRSRHTWENAVRVGNPIPTYPLTVEMIGLETNCTKAVIRTRVSGERIEVEVKDKVLEKEKSKT